MSSETPLDQRLMEIAVAGRLGELHEDESKIWVNCHRCGREHLGELYSSPPDGFYCRYYCLRTEGIQKESFI